MNHSGKVALVLGASKGLGKACASALKRDGATVIISSHDEKNLSLTKKELDVDGILCDNDKEQDIRKLVHDVLKKYKRIDILVNNTGGPKPGTFFELNEKDFVEAHNRLLLSSYRIFSLVVPMMQKQKFGRIITIASIAVKEPIQHLVLSNVYRSGVVSLSKTLSKEVAKDNVLLNVVAPAAFKTERFVTLMERKVQPGKTLQDVEKEIVAGIPLGRLQDPKELGEVVSFLASEECTLTGVTLPLDGGNSSGLF